MSSCESSWLYDCFVLYWCQSTQPGLSATSVICPLDPGHDRDSQLVASDPPATVENVLLQQGEERFHGRVIARCADSSHRPDDAVTGQSPSEFLRSELAAAVAVPHASAHVTAPNHSHLEGIDSQPGLHPRADRIANDPRRVGVLDRTEVELALIRMVLRVGSDRGALPASRLVSFPGPPSEPDVPIPEHPALHANQAAALSHGVGIRVPRNR